MRDLDLIQPTGSEIETPQTDYNAKAQDTSEAYTQTFYYGLDALSVQFTVTPGKLYVITCAAVGGSSHTDFTFRIKDGSTTVASKNATAADVTAYQLLGYKGPAIVLRPESSTITVEVTAANHSMLFAHLVPIAE